MSIKLIRTKEQYDAMISDIVDEFRNDGGSLEVNVELSPLRHECNRYWILAFSPNSDAIEHIGEDLVQLHILNGLHGLLEAAARHAVLADCNAKLMITKS